MLEYVTVFLARRMNVATWLCVVVVTSLVTCDDVMERQSSTQRIDECRLCILGASSSCAVCSARIAGLLVPYYAYKRSAVSRSKHQICRGYTSLVFCRPQRDLGLGSVVRLSVRLSVTSRYHVRTNNHRMTRFSSTASPRTTLIRRVTR